MQELVMHPWENYRVGQLIIAPPSLSTVIPDFDFETFSEAGYVFDHNEQKWISLPGLGDSNRGLKAVGTRNYVEHPSFRILSLAWDLKDGRGRRWWRPPELSDLFPATHHRLLCDVGELLDYVASGGLIEAFNVEFEWQVWEFYCWLKMGWPRLFLNQLRCCMAKSQAAAYPSNLKDVGHVLQLHEQKDPRGDKLVHKLTVPRKPTRTNSELRWTPITASEEFEQFYEYNRQDIRTEAEASMRLPDLSPRELEVWQTHLAINTRGMQIDTTARENCIAVVEQCFEKYNNELRQLTNYYVKGSTDVKGLLAWMTRQGVQLHSLDEDALEEALKRTDYPASVHRALQIRQQLAYGSVRKLYAFRTHTTTAGRLCNQYVYYGAHTGLWNGRAVQPANLYKGMFSKLEEAERALSIISARCLELVEFEYPGVDPLEVVASCLRSLIIARPGCRLISADFTAIQAVATAALAGEEWRLEVFRTHGKMYETMASILTGKPLQFYIDYKKQHGKHHSDRQDFGKLPVLSGDFGAWIGGWKRFDADKILGSDARIKEVILATRKSIPNIVEFWGGQTRNKFDRAPDGSRANAYEERYGLEGAAINAIREPGKAFGYRGIVYQMYEDTLYCRPPSGGFLRYHAPRLARSMRDYADPWEMEITYEGWNSNAMKGIPGWMRMKLYGGVLTQNTVSHMCREIQADALMRLEAHGYPVVMHTHDENVTEVSFGQGSLAEYNSLVRILPEWAKTPDGQWWPIKVPDAWEFPRYGKWED